MSIIFQLFSAEDLRKLEYSELEALRGAVLKALHDDSSKASKPRAGLLGPVKPPENVQELKQRIEEVFDKPPPPRATRSTNSRDAAQNELRALKNSILEVLNTPAEKLYLNLTEKTQIDEESPPDIQNQPGVNEALNNRFQEVYRQLKATSSSPPPNFDYDKLINQAISPVEELILRWAISCELNHIEFYARLLTARKAAYAEFTRMMRTGSGGRKAIPGFDEAHITPPDSRYSPFNPRSPLYRQYVASPISAPKPPGSYTPTGS